MNYCMLDKIHASDHSIANISSALTLVHNSTFYLVHINLEKLRCTNTSLFHKCVLRKEAGYFPTIKYSDHNSRVQINQSLLDSHEAACLWVHYIKCLLEINLDSKNSLAWCIKNNQSTSIQSSVDLPGVKPDCSGFCNCSSCKQIHIHTVDG